LIKIPVIRENGSFGEVTVFIEAQDITATQGYDYKLPKASVVIIDGTNQSDFNVIIENDSLPEFEESFSLVITSIKGVCIQ